jgi:hypothetical protein
MLTLNDGRSELWQWDTGRTLSVDAECSQVHFGRNVYGRSIDVDVVDGVATIPDILLQTEKELTAWAYVGTAENGYTKISKVFKVNKRNKPADYVFTPTEQVTLDKILERLKELEERPSGEVDPEEIKNIVAEYLHENPVEVEETDPTVPEWAKSKEKPTYTAEEVGAQPKGDYALKNEIPKIPTELPNPNKLIFSGAVSAEYDGSKEVNVNIPESKGIEVSGAEVGQFLKVSAVDENGHPTAWESADPVNAVFKHIRTVTIPNDVTTDTSGVIWEVDENTGGAVFTFDTDKDGNDFVYNELFIVYKCCSTNSNNVTPALVGPDLVTRYWTQECIPLAVGKTNAFTTGWAALFRVPGTDYCIPMGAYNNNGGTPILTNMSSVRDALKYRKNASAISLLDSNSSTNPGFAVGSTFDFYVR